MSDLSELRNLFSLLPRFDQEDASFADDVMAAVNPQPAMPRRDEMGVIFDATVRRLGKAQRAQRYALGK